MTAALVIFSHPTRRAREVAELLERIRTRGGSGDTPPIVWTGDGGPVDVPAADIRDFMALLRAPFLEGRDLVFLEDDVEPCQNAIPFMLEWGAALMTSFFNPCEQGRTYGLNRGFIFSQAFKLPWPLLERIRREPFPPDHPKSQRDGIDKVINRYLVRWNLPFLQHRSLVEHRGEVSTWTTSTLAGAGRRSQDWPGPDVDAYAL